MLSLGWRRENAYAVPAKLNTIAQVAAKPT
jgi:hypothetical protein